METTTKEETSLEPQISSPETTLSKLTWCGLGIGQIVLYRPLHRQAIVIDYDPDKVPPDHLPVRWQEDRDGDGRHVSMLPVEEVEKPVYDTKGRVLNNTFRWWLKCRLKRLKQEFNRT